MQSRATGLFFAIFNIWQFATFLAINELVGLHRPAPYRTVGRMIEYNQEEG
jgi:hypothetical protein